MEYFAAHELVCPHVFKKHGENSFMFADERLLLWLTWFRDTIKRPVLVNNYGTTQGYFTQRGYRCNLCHLVSDKTSAGILYASAHTRFQAVDFSVDDMNDEEVRQFIDRHKKDMPVKIRIEKNTIGWCHVDVATDSFEMITYFYG